MDDNHQQIRFINSNPSGSSAAQHQQQQATKRNNSFPRPRAIQSCLPCRRRKVRCDRASPKCSGCVRNDSVCSYVKPNPSFAASEAAVGVSSSPIVRRRGELGNRGIGNGSRGESGSGNHGSGNKEISARLERLESLLEKALAPQQERQQQQGLLGNGQLGEKNILDNGGVEASHHSDANATAVRDINEGEESSFARDADDDTLLLGKGQSHFVSSMHWALMSDEIHLIKELLLDHQEADSPSAGDHHDLLLSDDDDCLSPSSSLFIPPNTKEEDALSLLPDSAAECRDLLKIFLCNVDPLTRIVHKPSLVERFNRYVASVRPDGVNIAPPLTKTERQSFEPLAMAIFYGAINSISPTLIQSKFNAAKDSLLHRFSKGVRLSLERERYLMTPNLEVLQALVLNLSCRFKDDDLGESWPLTGLAISIARAQGLHKEPLYFQPGKIDNIQVELRRRLWHQICHLDFRAAEGCGQEPTISDNSFTTLLPSNVSDANLGEHNIPHQLLEANDFTDMTPHLIRLNGIHSFRTVVQHTYQLERKVKSSWDSGDAKSAVEPQLHAMYDEIRTITQNMISRQHQWLQHCNDSDSMHRMTMEFAPLLEWKCWVIFWLRIPKAYRERVFPTQVRELIFTKSVMMLESLIIANHDRDAAPFQWHIEGHSAFQAIMHLLSELKTPEFCALRHIALRERAVSAIRGIKALKESKPSKTWRIVGSQIDRALSTLDLTSPSSTRQTPVNSMPPSINFMNEGLSETPITSQPTPVMAGAHNGASDVASMINMGNAAVVTNAASWQDSQPMGLELESMQNGPDDFDWGGWTMNESGLDLLNLESYDMNGLDL